ncbi:MAG: FAD-dependent oxidoreductase [Planctomycetota bacterium]
MKNRVMRVILGVFLVLCVVSACSGQTVLVEAESFGDLGGWPVDQQFMDQMGSPYLLAHGLGEPVEDATKTVEFPKTGRYRVWVRTRDWVAPWKAPGAPGRFQLLIEGKPIKTIFGTEGAGWHWQDGGTVKINKKRIEIALHDLTGFEGRCDAIIFSRDADFVPPNEAGVLTAFRRKALGLADKPADGGEYDLVVVGGGMAGTCAAISGARSGLQVALVQDRPVLGGNNSSEVRVWLGGKTNFEPYPRIGDIVQELDPNTQECPAPAGAYKDEKKLCAVRAEKNIRLFLNMHVYAVEKKGDKIASVTARHIGSGEEVRFSGAFFADCTGDGTVGFLADASFGISVKGHMGRTNLWRVTDTGKPSAFERCPWALDLSDKPFPGRKGNLGAYNEMGIEALGKWFWESGFDLEPFEEGEYIRDWNFRAMYGAWDCLKNVDKMYPNHKLEWAAYISGMRESRRLVGDIILGKKDLVSGKVYPDGCVPVTWTIDLHRPHKQYKKGFEGDAFISKDHHTKYDRPYWLPYRCLYSRSVRNLFMAGRDISVSHEALGAVRVMRTTGMMGEVVGMAASLCKKHGTSPRRVYKNHLEELKALMRRGVGKKKKEAKEPVLAWRGEASY